MKLELAIFDLDGVLVDTEVPLPSMEAPWAERLPFQRRAQRTSRA